MNITFEEAEQRFKPGDQFIINSNIPNKSIFLVGDIVKLTGFYEFMDRWGIHCEWVKQVEGDREFRREKTLAIHCSYIEPVDENKTLVCTCNIFIGPCTCGVFKAEMEKKYGKT